MRKKRTKDDVEVDPILSDSDVEAHNACPLFIDLFNVFFTKNDGYKQSSRKIR